MSQLAYTQADAAAQLGISVNHFKQHVRPHLRAVYIGGATRYPHAELERWLEGSMTSR